MPTLDFKGKQHIYAHHLTIPHRPLIPHKDKSINALPHINMPNATPDAHSPDHNLIIHGDNLHALKALTPRYAGRVNCIYIDPAIQHRQRKLDLQRQSQQPPYAAMAQRPIPR